MAATNRSITRSTALKNLPPEIKTEEEFQQLIKAMDKQHIKFADQYLLSMNATKSYLNAGYKPSNQKSNQAAASRLLATETVQKYITYIFNQRQKSYAFQESAVLGKVHQFSKSKITDYFDVKSGSLYLKDFKKLTPEMIECISEIQETKEGIKIKLIDKLSATVTYGKHFGMFQTKKGDENSGLQGRTNFIVKVFVVPQIKNVMMTPTINEGTALEMVNNYIKERNKIK